MSVQSMQQRRGSDQKAALSVQQSIQRWERRQKFIKQWGCTERRSNVTPVIAHSRLHEATRLTVARGASSRKV